MLLCKRKERHSECQECNTRIYYRDFRLQFTSDQKQVDVQQEIKKGLGLTMHAIRFTFVHALFKTNLISTTATPNSIESHYQAFPFTILIKFKVYW